MNKNFVKNDTLDDLEGHRGHFPRTKFSYFSKCKCRHTFHFILCGDICWLSSEICTRSLIAVDIYSTKANLKKRFSRNSIRCSRSVSEFSRNKASFSLTRWSLSSVKNLVQATVMCLDTGIMFVVFAWNLCWKWIWNRNCRRKKRWEF